MSSYEEMVGSPEDWARRLAAFLGISEARAGGYGLQALASQQWDHLMAVAATQRKVI